MYVQGWPEVHMYTVYGGIYGGFPAKSTVDTPYTYSSVQPYVCCMLFRAESVQP